MRKMTAIMNLAAAAALAGILLTGCSTEADETTTAAATTAAEAETTTAAGGAAETTEGGALAGKKISVMTPYLTSVTTNQMAGYIKEDLEAEGAEVFVIDTANDFAELASRIEDVVSSGTDGIVLVSADPNQVANQLQDAFDAGIPVFGCDSGFIDGMQVNATSDNYQMGELIVRYLFDDLMGGKGTVIALTHRPHPGVVKRCEAFDDIIKEYPDIKLITEQHVPAEQPINDAQDIVANLLTANPEKDSITAVFAAWDEPAIGATKALQEAGRDEVIVTGVDGNEQAIEMIKAARKPFIFVGGGAVASDAANELSAFAHKVQAPVGDSLMGKGAFDGTDVLYTGMIGMHGTKTSNLGVAECDLLIVVGARFSDRVVGDPNHFATNAKILHIDIDPAEINKNIQTDASIIGDVKIILRKLNARLDPMNHDEWLSHIERLKDMYPLRYNKEVLTGPYIMEEIYKVTGGDAIICTDVGQHQMWAAQYYKYKRPRQLLTSGGLGTMGYGLGAAIGAKMGCKDKTVINIAGDGCFRMNMNEIATATRYNIPVIEVVFNNHVLGMVRQWQTLFYGKRYSQTELYDQMDFVKVAEGMGAKAYRITKKEDVEPVLREAISLNIPVMIECQIGSDDKVFPMVPAGKPIEEAFDEIDLRIE